MNASTCVLIATLMAGAGGAFAQAPISSRLLLAQNPSTAFPDAPAQHRSSSVPDGKRVIDDALRLTPAARRQLSQMLANSRGTATSGAAPDATGGAGIGSVMPAGVSLQDFPPPVLDQVPQLVAYKYVQLSDRILLIEPTSRVIVDEIAD